MNQKEFNLKQPEIDSKMDSRPNILVAEKPKVHILKRLVRNVPAKPSVEDRVSLNKIRQVVEIKASPDLNGVN